MKDAYLIEQLGGSTAVAKRLGWMTVNASRRVNNWKRRGIPAAVKLKYPEIFLPGIWPKWQPQPKQQDTQPPKEVV